MIKYTELALEDRLNVFLKADSFFNDHSSHVQLLIVEEKNSYPPSGSDLFHPELWKGSHWRWYLFDACKN